MQSQIINERHVDVTVIGGGLSGVCAAISAARAGCSVLLVEQSGCCGGMATQGLVGPFMTCYDRFGEKMILRGLFEEIIDRLVAQEGAIHPSTIRAGTGYTSWIEVGHDHVTPFEPEKLKLLLDDMLQEAGVELLYHTLFIEPILEENKIIGTVLATKAGFEAVYSKIVIDCSGDGDVAVRAGVPYELGSETDHKIQPATMFFRIGNVDSDALEAEIQAHKGEFYRKDGVNYRSLHWRISEARENGDWTLSRVSIGIFKSVKPDEWAINTSRITGINATDNDSWTHGEIEGRKQANEIFQFLRKYVPGCENAKLLATGSTLGIRETRHIQGNQKMEISDIVDGVTPPDSILVCSNSVDIHGYYGPLSNKYVTVEKGAWYGIPYECLVPQKIDGLLMAGRCLSASSEASGAVRVMPVCMCMGHAAGTAAALAIQRKILVKDMNVSELRAILLKQGAFLPE